MHVPASTIPVMMRLHRLAWCRPRCQPFLSTPSLVRRIANQNLVLEGKPNRSLNLATMELIGKPPRHIFDVLSPTNSHLLNVTLDQYLPTTCVPKEYTLNLGKHPLAPMRRLPQSMPQGHHLVYFPTPVLPAELEGDGTDPYHSPGKPFTRRVWAGGSIDFTRDNLTLGSTPAVCIETIEKVESKGTYGVGKNKIFVHMMRRYIPMSDSQTRSFNETDMNCLTERRILAFMRKKKTGEYVNAPVEMSRIVKAPWKPQVVVETVMTPEILFYFSALTFNAHSIHLDVLRNQEMEGHPSLLIHGPLCVVLMMNVVRSVLLDGDRKSESVHYMEYRNLAPLYANDKIRICVSDITPDNKPEYVTSHRRTVWIEDSNGSLCVKGTVHIGPKKGYTAPPLPAYTTPRPRRLETDDYSDSPNGHDDRESTFAEQEQFEDDAHVEEKQQPLTINELRKQLSFHGETAAQRFTRDPPVKEEHQKVFKRGGQWRAQDPYAKNDEKPLGKS